MAEYEPPREILPIFDPEDFIHTNDEPLTLETASKYFLKFPYGQGLEYIPDLIVGSTTTLNGTLAVAGLSDFNDNVNISVSGSGVANPTLTIQSNNDDDKGAYLKFYKNSQSPANDDRTGAITFWSNTLTGGGGVGPAKEVGRFRNAVIDYTHNAEDAKFNWMLMKGGLLTEVADMTSTSFNLLNNLTFTQSGTGVIQQTGTGQNELKDTNVIGTLLVNGSPVGASANLSQVLSFGNSAGLYSINMNGNDISNIRDLFLYTPAITGERTISYERALNTTNGAGLGILKWLGLSSTSVSREYGRIRSFQQRTNDGAEDGSIDFSIIENGTPDTLYMRLGSSSSGTERRINMYRQLYTQLSNSVPARFENTDTTAGDSSIQVYKSGVSSSNTTSISLRSNNSGGSEREMAKFRSTWNNNSSSVEESNAIISLQSLGALTDILSMSSSTTTLTATTFTQRGTSVGSVPIFQQENTQTPFTDFDVLVLNGRGKDSNNSTFFTYGRLLIEGTNITSGALAGRFRMLLMRNNALTQIVDINPNIDTTQIDNSILTIRNNATPATDFDIMTLNANGKDSNNSTYFTYGQLLFEGQSVATANKQTRMKISQYRNGVFQDAFAIDNDNVITDRELELIPVSTATTTSRVINMTTYAKVNGSTLGEINFTGYNDIDVSTGYGFIRNIEANVASANTRGRLELSSSNTSELSIGADNGTTDRKITANLKTFTTQGLEVSNSFKVNTTTTAPSTDVEFQLNTSSSGAGLGVRLYKNQTTLLNGETIGSVDFYSNTSTLTEQPLAHIKAINNTNTTIDGEIDFSAYTGGSATTMMDMRPTQINSYVPLIVNDALKYKTLSVALSGNVSYSTNYTFLGGYLIITSNTSTANTITLPTIANASGYVIFIRNESTTRCILSSTANFLGAYGSGTTSYTLNGGYSIKMYSNGTNYSIFEEDVGSNVIPAKNVVGTFNTIIETHPRYTITTSINATMGRIFLTGFVSPTTKTINNINTFVATAGTAVSYINCGIYTYTGTDGTGVSGSLTLSATGTSKTSLTTGTNTFAISGGYTLQANTPYLIGILFYNGGATQSTPSVLPISTSGAFWNFGSTSHPYQLYPVDRLQTSATTYTTLITLTAGTYQSSGAPPKIYFYLN